MAQINRRNFLGLAVGAAATGAVAGGGIAIGVIPQPPFLRKAPKIETFGEVSDEFVSRLEEELPRLPQNILDTMEAYGTTIVACPKITDYKADLRNQPIDGIKDLTYNSVLGIQYGKKILVAEKYFSPYSSSIEKVEDVEWVLRHEVGHYMDKVGRIVELTDTNSFKEAYYKDLNIINSSGFNSYERERLSYYTKNTLRARSETFAEVFASMTGSGSRINQDQFPNVRNYIKSELNFEPVSSPEPAYKSLSLSTPPNYWFCATGGLMTSAKNASASI